MSEMLRLALLGTPQIIRGQEIGGFISLKAQVLLCYLAATNRPHTREHLADLLWGDMPEQRARASLRTALHNLQQLTGDFVSASRAEVAFVKRPNCRLDLDEFAREIADPSDPERLLRATNLYRGEFLDGVAIADAPALEAWLFAQRAEYRQRVTHALDSLVAQFTARQDYAAAVGQARRLLTIEPWNESMHRHLMQLLARQGRLSAALAQYEECRRILLRELDVMPLPETTVIYERIRAARAVRHQTLPAPTTPFVGREKDLSALTNCLHDPSCRLLTLAGLGGVGKTRLALQVAALERHRFLNGVCYVPVDSITAPHTLATAIAKALDLPSNPDPIPQLLAYLRSKEMLLVVDDADNLLPGADLLAEITRVAHDIKILVTSRRRLNLRQEWVYDLQGLSYPPHEASSPLPNPEHYDAVQLFLATAHRYRPAAQVGPLEPVVHICRIVEGMPLGIELAAAWTRTMTPQDIVREIERSLDLLSSPLQNMSARHQSLNAVFEQSWRSLEPNEQAIAKRLSVFKNGFSRDAAFHVAAATPQTLTELADKSLLRMSTTGRFELHQLLRQFMAGKLAADDEDAYATHQRYAHYYAHYLARREQQSRHGQRQADFVKSIAEEIDNIRAVWAWIVDQAQTDLLQTAHEGLYLFYEYRGWFQEGIECFEAAVHALETRHAQIARPQDDATSQTARSALLGKLLARAGWFHWRLNRYHAARERLQEGLRRLPEGAAPSEAIFVLGALGLVADSLGEYTAARGYHRRSLDICRQTGDQLGESRVLDELGVVARLLGSHAEATQMHHAALTISRDLSDHRAIATVLNNQGLVAQRLGEYARAEAVYQEALAIRRRLGDAWGSAVSLITLADLYCDVGRLAEAEAYLFESDEVCHETGGPWGQAYWLMVQGKWVHCQGDPAGAAECHTQSLAIWRTIGVQSKIARTLGYMGSDLLALGNDHEPEHYFQESAITSRRIGYRSGLAAALLGLGQVATARRTRRTAGLYLSRALRVAEEIQERPLALAVQCEQAQLIAQANRPQQACAALASIICDPAARFGTRKLAEQRLASYKDTYALAK